MLNKYKNLFREIRKCNKCKTESIRLLPCEPGLWRKDTKILFIGENPGYPKPDILPSDKEMMRRNISDDEFHEQYEISQRSWKFHDFITNFCKWEYASIINICRCPTIFNKGLTLKMIENCNEYLEKSIKLINPRVIICVGSLAWDRVKRLNLGCKIIKSRHYSYLLRSGKENYIKEIKKIKKELKNGLGKYILG